VTLQSGTRQHIGTVLAEVDARSGLLADVTAAHEQHGTTGVVHYEARGVADRVGTGTRVDPPAGEMDDEMRTDGRGDRANLSPRLAHADLGRVRR